MISYSIVICAFNQRRTLGLILESIRTQITAPKMFEVVIADDCSDDGTDDFVRKRRYPIFLKYSRCDKNQGRAANRNRGFEKSAGKKIICIDGDMVPGPGFIEAYLSAWEEFPGAVILGSRRLPSEWPNGNFTRYLYSRGRLPMPHGTSLPGRLFTSDNFSIDKEIFAKTSGFDTAFSGWGGEDTDFGIRLENNGVPMYAVPSAWCFHYHDKSLENTIIEFEKFGRNGFPLLVDRYPEQNIYSNGWVLGLPLTNAGMGKKILAELLRPLHSSPILGILQGLGRINRGALFSDFFFDWLLYGYMARGYRKSKR